jgi:hypothetical protein
MHEPWRQGTGDEVGEALGEAPAGIEARVEDGDLEAAGGAGDLGRDPGGA